MPEKQASEMEVHSYDQVLGVVSSAEEFAEEHHRQQHRQDDPDAPDSDRPIATKTAPVADDRKHAPLGAPTNPQRRSCQPYQGWHKDQATPVAWSEFF